MSAPTPLVLAKAPVPGEVKTRLGADVGELCAAELAAAALLDTLETLSTAFPDAHGVVALAGDLDAAVRHDELVEALRGWTVVAQRGDTFAERIVRAHAAVAGPVLQVGMDTPHVDVATLQRCADLLARHDAVLGPAEDGGWWVLGLADPRRAEALRDVPTSQDDTGRRTWEALARVVDVAAAPPAYDVDTVAEAERAAADAPGTRFAAVWHDRRPTTVGRAR